MGNRILIVEDDADTRENMCDVLELFDYVTDTAETLEQTVSHPELAEFSFILLDRRLPDGIADEVLPKLKSLAPNASVVIVTGHGDVNSTIQAMQNGAADYILKPIDPSRLNSSLQRIARLRLAESRAAQSERLAGIGQMMAGIAHESRNAVQRIQAGLDMIKLDFSDADEVQYQWEKIKTANESLRLMLDEIRDFAAPIQLQRETTSLAAIWKRAWEHVTSVAGESAKDAQLCSGSDDQKVRYSMDSFRIEQVFRNLFENSIAAADGPVTVTVDAKPNEGGKGWCVRICDNGPGIPAKHAASIFDPFYTTKQKGTGLGMAISKRTIEAHGGTMRLGDQTNGCEVIIDLV